MLQSGGYAYSADMPDPKNFSVRGGRRAQSLYDLSDNVKQIDNFVSHSVRMASLSV